MLAANLGGDADTVAAVAGGIAVALWGFEALPGRWVGALGDGDVARLDAAVAAAVQDDKVGTRFLPAAGHGGT